MTRLSVLLFFVLGGVACQAQDITVHIVNDKTDKPIAGLSVLLWKDCQNPNRPKAMGQKTDSTGATTFRAVSLADGICVNPFSVVYGYAPHNLDYVFVSPEKLGEYKKSLNTTISVLPADITFRMRRRSLGEQLTFLFRGP